MNCDIAEYTEMVPRCPTPETGFDRAICVRELSLLVETNREIGVGNRNISVGLRVGYPTEYNNRPNRRCGDNEKCRNHPPARRPVKKPRQNIEVHILVYYSVL